MHGSSNLLEDLLEKGTLEVQFKKRLCNSSLAGLQLSAQLAILKRSLTKISDIAIDSRTVRKRQDENVALPSQWSWKRPECVWNGWCTFFGVGTCGGSHRRVGTLRPRPAPPPRPPPRTPAEAGLGQLRAELQRWPDAKCKCKLLWKPQQRRVPNPEQDLARGTSGSAPHIPPVSASPRPQPRPTRCSFLGTQSGNAGAAGGSLSAFPLWGLSPARFWLLEPSKQSRSF